MIQINQDFIDFVDTHRNDDPVKLRLKFHGCGQQWIGSAITHIECVRKAKGKFGEYQPELMLSTLSIEQATSANVADLHADIAESLAGQGARLLDMTCGLGIDLKAIARRLNGTSIGIEMQPELAEAGKYNFRNDKNVTIIEGDSVEWLDRYSGDKFDLIFIDPARRGDNGERIYNIHDCKPDVSSLIPLFREKCRYVLVKLSPMLDVTQTLRDLPMTRTLYVVDDGGECRELLAVLDFANDQVMPEVVVASDGVCMKFLISEEAHAVASFGNPESGKYLFEPSPAAMKAQPFSLLSERFGLSKLHRNTHLYVSEQPVPGLPGKWYAIENAFDFASSRLKEIGRLAGRADVAVRNHHITPEELSKRLKIKSGGHYRIMCCTAGDVPRFEDRGVLLLLRRYFF